MLGGKFHHIGVVEGELPNRVLLPGSRARVKLIMRYLKSVKTLSDERQLVVVGRYKGKRVGVIDTGMGPSSAAIIIREVIEAVQPSDRMYLIRPGTSGSLQDWVSPGDLVVSTGALAQENVSSKIIGPRYPLFCDHEVIYALIRAAEQMGYELGGNLHVGVTHTKDALYEVEDPQLSASPTLFKENLRYLNEAGVLCTEMELSVLIALAARYNANWMKAKLKRRVKVGGVFLVLSPFSGGVEFKEVEEHDLVKVALEGITSLKPV